MDNLQTLDLSNNRLRVLDVGLLRGKEKLARIFLGDNMITSVPDMAMSGTVALNEVQLQNNRIETFGEMVFGENPAIVWMDLNGNRMNSFGEKKIAEGGHIQNLLLAENNISTFNLTSLMGTEVDLLDVSNQKHGGPMLFIPLRCTSATPTLKVRKFHLGASSNGTLSSLVSAFHDHQHEGCGGNGVNERVVFVKNDTEVMTNVEIARKSRGTEGVHIVVDGVEGSQKDEFTQSLEPGGDMYGWCDGDGGGTVTFTASFAKSELYFHYVTDEEAGTLFQQDHASRICRSVGREIVSIVSEKENDIVLEFAVEKVAEIGVGNHVNHVLLGCNVTQVKGNIKWRDGTPFVYNNVRKDVSTQFEYATSGGEICRLQVGGGGEQGTWDLFQNDVWFSGHRARGIVCGPVGFSRLYDPCEG